MRAIIILNVVVFLSVTGACATVSAPAPDLGDDSPVVDSSVSGTGSEGTPDAAGDAPTAYNLNGFWDDNGRVIHIMQTGSEVIANYVETYICDHNDGAVPPGETHDGVGETSETDLDFHATLNAGQLIGETNVCNWEAGGATHELGAGLMLAPMELTVSEDGTELTGSWYNEHDDTDEPITITRLPSP